MCVLCVVGMKSCCVCVVGMKSCLSDFDQTKVFEASFVVSVNSVKTGGKKVNQNVPVSLNSSLIAPLPLSFSSCIPLVPNLMRTRP